MSDRRLLLDGPDLPALVAQAEGLGGRVVRAERLRKGLLGRAWYEVTVEVPGLSGATPPAAAARPRPRPDGGSHSGPHGRPAGIGDLLAAAEAAERLDAAASRAARATGAGSAKKDHGR